MDTEHDSHRDTASMDSEAEDPLSPPGSAESSAQERGRSRVRQSSRRRGRGSMRERCGGRGRGRTSEEGGSVGSGRGRRRGSVERGRGGVGLRRGGRVRARGRGRYCRSSSACSPNSSAGKKKSIRTDTCT